MTNYDEFLTSKLIPEIDAYQTFIIYDIYFSPYDITHENTMAVEIWDGFSWHIVRDYSSFDGGIPWTTEMVEITTYTVNPFRIRFHAAGTDSFYINNWNLDNIKILARDSVNHCFIGYAFYIDYVLSAILGTDDTTYFIPPEGINYGQSYDACIEAIYNYSIPAYSSPECNQFTSCFLYPPNNFAVQPIECGAYLSWQKPEMMGSGGVPPGLIGYRIYRSSDLYDSILSPDVLEYYDLPLQTGKYSYWISAVYDLTPYGFPGQIDESKFTNRISVNVMCGDNLPFTENWDLGTFTFYDWTFEPSQGNWDINTSIGNPAPTADFSWLGTKTVGDYDFSMISPALDATLWECSAVWLDFDIKLVDRNVTSTEFMTVEIYYDGLWHQVGEYKNSGSFGFTTEHINIDAVRGKGFKIRFRAHGEDSYNLMHWYLDNIKAYGVCLPPSALEWDLNPEEIELNWQAPCENVSGYNVFRSDSTGNPPFTKLNQDLVTGTEYLDNPSYWNPDASYRYFVTAVTVDSINTGILCESGSSDTIFVAFPVGIPCLNPDDIKVFPNPAQQQFTVASTIPMMRLELSNNIGNILFSKDCQQSTTENVTTQGMSAGLYFLKVSTLRGTAVKKVFIMR